jgi:ankyrin repeat protein
MAQCVIAIKSNQPQEVQRWLDKDRRLLTLELEGDSTALHLACEFSSPELVGALLRTLKQRNKLVIPGNPVYKSAHLNVLLEKALTNAGRTKCELLLKLGAEIEQREASTQNTLLHRMVIQGYPESASWLLEKKASLESRNIDGNTPLLLSVGNNNIILAELLLRKGANPQVKNAEQQSPVLIALLNQNKSILGLLVGAKKAALSSLHLALELNDNEIIKVLLRHSSDAIEAQDEQGRTPFYSAVERGNLEAARLLLAQGANTSVSWGTAQLNILHVASRRSDVEMLRYLLQTRASALIDVQNANGDTPLHVAVKAGHDSVIPLLLEAGAYHKIKNEQEQTPIELARMEQKPKLANLIVQTLRGLKQAKLKETDRLHQVVAEQANKIAHLEASLQSQEKCFKVQLSDMQQTILSMLPMLHQFQVVQEEKRRIEEIRIQAVKEEKRRIEEIRIEEIRIEAKRNAEKEKCLHLAPEFLRWVAEGEQDKAEAMLKSNPALALVPGDVTDLSKRVFNGITGFQYAVWALDWHMWTMIRKYLPDEDARLQAQGFEAGAWVGKYGVRANLYTLIQAYKTTIDLYEAFKHIESNTAWIQQVGGAQLLLPAHVINEYCHPTRPFYPLPNFKDAATLPRSRTIKGGDWFTASSHDESFIGGKLGEKFACSRSWMAAARACWWFGSEEKADYEMVVALTQSREAQRDELIAELRPRHVQRNAA